MEQACLNCQKWGTVECPIRYNSCITEEDWKKLDLKRPVDDNCYLWKKNIENKLKL